MIAWTLRAAGDDDDEFLFRVYAGTRAEELAQTGWDAAQLETFLRMQFAAQAAHYRREFPAAEYTVVQAGGVDVGRLYLDRRDDEICILDIALLPGYRRLGLGSALLRAVLAEAATARRRVVLHVERDNPALGLYLRLGFVEIDERGIYKLMHWQLPADDARSPPTPVSLMNTAT